MLLLMLWAQCHKLYVVWAFQHGFFFEQEKKKKNQQKATYYKKRENNRNCQNMLQAQAQIHYDTLSSLGPTFKYDCSDMHTTHVLQKTHIPQRLRPWSLGLNDYVLMVPKKLAYGFPL